jgi:hypothetical protein
MEGLHVVRYFLAPKYYFWYWADGGKVIEFRNGTTVCYREDLLFILQSLNLPRALPFSTFILLFCACKNNFEATYNFEATLQYICDQDPTANNEGVQLQQLLKDSMAFLRLVNSLSYSYRMGLKRIPLYQAIFEDYFTEDSKTHNLKELVSQFNTGTFDEYVFIKRDGPHLSFKNILRPLADALKQFPTKEALELKLRAGLTALPGKAEIELPAPVPGNLFDILEADAKTAGISMLARHIIGALSIPMHLSGSSDQSVGGVSDISNRGHYDKLLLSELAQDDLLLTARLANNEALFLQREELPVNNSQEWHILLDTTLKMWGLPRIFGLAAGLAFSEGRKKKEAMNAWALGGKQATAIDLHSKEGIIQTLEQLDPALNCGAQLGKFLSDQKGQKGKYIMITAAHYKEDTAFLAHFLPLKDQLDYLVVVGRDGHIELFETQGGRHKLLNQATIDLDSLLFARPKRFYNNTNKSAWPAMLQHRDFPLYFPASKIKLKPDVVRFNQQRAVIITQDKRVLLWQAKDRGAIELVNHIETGEYFWGDGGAETLFLLVKIPANDFVLIYQLDIIHYTYSMVQSAPLKADDVRFLDNLFYIKSGDEVFSIKPQTGQRAFFLKKDIIKTESGEIIFTDKTSPGAMAFSQPQVTPHITLLNQVKRFINNGYSAINSATSVYVSTNGRLFVDHRDLRLDPTGNHLSFKDNAGQVEWKKPYKQEAVLIEHLPKIKFTKFIWKNGSEAVVDSRGLLHLKSADASLPEITIILVIEKTTACWASDGMVTGSSYFTDAQPNTYIAAEDFYNNYIQPFIDKLA